eukprot:6020161-Alexandrium_andersonii.AAC.1
MQETRRKRYIPFAVALEASVELHRCYCPLGPGTGPPKRTGCSRSETAGRASSWPCRGLASASCT